MFGSKGDQPFYRLSMTTESPELTAIAATLECAYTSVGTLHRRRFGSDERTALEYRQSNM